MKRLRCCSIVAPLAIVAVAALPSSASVVFDSGGFEPPGYSTTFDPMTPGSYAGQLEGQSGWQRSLDSGTSTAVIQKAVVNSGVQAVQLDRAPDCNIRWGVPTSGFPTSPTDQIRIDWAMLVRGSSGNPATDFGPFMGVEAYALPGGGLSLLGSLGVDATTGEVLYQDPAVGGVLVAPGPVVAFGAWNTFSIILDYLSQTYSIVVNSSTLASGIGFVDGPRTTFSDADLSGLTAAAGSEGVTATAFYDDFGVLDTPAAPEPAAISVWVLGGIIASGVCWKKHAFRRAV